MNQQDLDNLQKKYNIKTPGDEIKQQILSKGLTAEQVNKDLSLPPNTIDKLITAEIPLTEEYINVLHKYLELPYSHFVNVGKEYIKEMMAALNKEHGL